MKKLTFLLLASLGCSAPEPDPKGTAWDTEEITDSLPVRPEPEVTEVPEDVEESDPNGENYREVWGREHRQRITLENYREVSIPPYVRSYGGLDFQIRWPQITRPRQVSLKPGWMYPEPNQERWLTIALLSSSDPRPRKFDLTWYDGERPRGYVGPWGPDSQVFVAPTYRFDLQDRSTESRLPPFIQDISDLDEIYIRLDVPSTGHYFERICRRTDDYQFGPPYQHIINCQLTADDLSSWD